LNTFPRFGSFCVRVSPASLFPFNKRLAIGAGSTPPHAPAMLPLFIFAPLLSLLPSVAAHGFVSKVVIDGTTYNGNVPNAKPSNSPIRQISDIGPVKGSNNPSLNCGLNAQLATMVVPANPGSAIEFYWGNPGGENVCFSCFPQAAPFA
jgi:Auxiliary Activity family 9 (formerly GH61)